MGGRDTVSLGILIRHGIWKIVGHWEVSKTTVGSGPSRVRCLSLPTPLGQGRRMAGARWEQRVQEENFVSGREVRFTWMPEVAMGKKK